MNQYNEPCNHPQNPNGKHFQCVDLSNPFASYCFYCGLGKSFRFMLGEKQYRATIVSKRSGAPVWERIKLEEYIKGFGYDEIKHPTAVKRVFKELCG